MLSKIGRSLASSARNSNHSPESHVGVSKETKGQAETWSFETETPARLQVRTNDEITEEGLLETPTQSFAHLRHQGTHLVDGNIEGCNLVSDSEGEGSGDTEVLRNEYDSHFSGCCEEDVESGVASRDTKLLNVDEQCNSSVPVSELGKGSQKSNLSRSVQKHESTRACALTKLDDRTARKRKKLFDSDAAVGDSSHDDQKHIEDSFNSMAKSGKGAICSIPKMVELSLTSNEKRRGDSKMRLGQAMLSISAIEDGTVVKAFEVEEPSLHRTKKDCTTSDGSPSFQTPKATLVAGVIRNLSPCISTSRSRSRSIASVRAASLRACGLRAAARNASFRDAENVIHTKRLETGNEQDCLPSVSHLACNNLDYIGSQEPDEYAQWKALNVVDDLVCLSATGTSHDTGPGLALQEPSVKGSHSAKGVQSLAKTAGIKTMQDKLGIYDWIDNQQDEGVLTSDVNDVPSTFELQKTHPEASKPVKARKRRLVSQQHNDSPGLQPRNSSIKELSPPLEAQKKLWPEARKLIKGSKRQTESEQRKVKSGLQGNRTKDIVSNKKIMTSDMKPSNFCEYISRNPQNLLSAQVQNGCEIETIHTRAVENVSNGKSREQKICIKDAKKVIEHANGISMPHSPTNDPKVWDLDGAIDSSIEDETESSRGYDIGIDTQMAVEAIEIMRHGPVSSAIWTEEAGKQHKTHEGTNAKKTEGRKQVIFKDDAGHVTKRCRLSGNKLKDKKQVSYANDVKEQHNHDTECEGCTRKEDGVKRGRKTTSKVQDLPNTLADSGSKYGLEMRRRPVTRPPYTMQTGQQQADGGQKVDSGSTAAPLSTKGNKESLSCNPTDPENFQKNNKRKREDFNGKPSDSLEANRMLQGRGFELQKVPRRLRSALCAPGSVGRNTLVAELQDDRRKDAVGSSPDRLMLPFKINTSALQNGTSHKKGEHNGKQLAVPSAKASKGQVQGKKTARFKNPKQLRCSFRLEEGRRRKREPGCIHVLFSHSLHEDTIKHQKKILAKLGGCVALSAAACTHFVADCFVRTRNMLESMVAGKPVVTSLWLESCRQACYFVDERNYILRDTKKEKEIRFSMSSSLAAAQCKPIFQGIKVLISPNVTPDIKTVTAIIEAGGGQVVQKMPGFSKSDATYDDTISVVVASERDYKFCIPFLERGMKVYSSELILNGIVVQNLDFSRNQLFENMDNLNVPQDGQTIFGNKKCSILSKNASSI